MESEPSVGEFFEVCADVIDSYQRATDLLQRALELAQVTQSSQMSWATTYLNLGTSHRKLK
jgi:anaphase-promoting complex subunit 6